MVADDVVASTRMGEEATQVGWRGVTRGPSGQCFVYPTIGWAPGLTRLNTPTTPQGGRIGDIKTLCRTVCSPGRPVGAENVSEPQKDR